MTVTFETLPQAVSELHEKLDRLLVGRLEKPESDFLLEVNALIDYLPGHPAKQTIYQWVCARSIPFEKHGKKLYFRRSIIDKWLANGRQMPR